MTLLLLLACSHIPRPSEEDAEAKALVEACVEAHGGLEAWAALGDVQVQVVDTWSSAAMAPYAPGDPQLTLNAPLGKGRVTFAEAEEVWGHDSVQAWALVDGAPAEPPRPDAIPTYSYFFSLPFKLADPGLRYEQLGAIELDGVAVEQVLVSFDEAVGADRYLLRIRADDHTLHSVLFTFMDMNPLVQLEASLDWQTLQGVRVPARYEIELLRPLRRPIHVITFEQPQVLQGFDRRAYERP
ncbi:MAG: hypothetical protein H6741_26990 [Alphaproteobacteria bacterium]|nr:hypothetical protein [Alphaproteobacteria bacterium]MCB9796358.1 hypothetical protein [Alphaproteobacteria bacterium]